MEVSKSAIMAVKGVSNEVRGCHTKLSNLQMGPKNHLGVSKHSCGPQNHILKSSHKTWITALFMGVASFALIRPSWEFHWTEITSKHLGKNLFLMLKLKKGHLTTI